MTLVRAQTDVSPTVTHHVIVDCYSISASRNMMPNDRHLICIVRLIDALNEKIKMKIYSVPCDILREKVAI